MPLKLPLVQWRDAKPSSQHTERLEVLQVRHARVTARLPASAQSPRTDLDVELFRPLEEEPSVTIPGKESTL